MRSARTGCLGLIILMGLVGDVAQAFSSFEIFGGAHHQRITEQALVPLGFRPESIRYIGQGLLEPDKFYRDKFHDSEHHFTEMDFQGGLHFLKTRKETILQSARDAPSDYQSYRRTLALLGGYLHTTQDFYAHTNWVERALVRGENPVPPASLTNSSELQGLASPYFLYTSIPAREIEEISKYERKFARSFYSKEELEELSDRERIRTSANPDHALIHKFLAKDNPDYPQSKLKWNSGGPTLFELASELAGRDTAVRWKALEQEMSPRVSSILRSGWFSDLPESSEETPVRIQRARVAVDSELSFEADFAFACRSWSRASARDAVDLFHQLTSDQVRMSSAQDGVRRLKLSKSETKKSFLFRLDANLYSAHDTFLTALPEDPENLSGPWLLQVRLPPERAGTTSVKVDSPGRVEALGENRFRLSPPANGWRLPDWVEEYVAEPKPDTGRDFSYSGCKTRG